MLKISYFKTFLTPAHRAGILCADSEVFAIAIDKNFRAIAHGHSPQSAFERLQHQIPPSEKCTHLSHEVAWHGLRLHGKTMFIVPPGSAPAEMKEAAEVLEKWAESRFVQLRLEFPHIPFESTQIQNHIEVLQKFKNAWIYNLENPDLKAAWKEITRRKKILLHVCCGPDAAGAIQQLKTDYDVLCFWYDPNIQPREEYDKRLEAFEKVALVHKVPYIIGEYDVDRFYEFIRGLEHTPEQGAKCSICYDMRLERSAIEAKKESCDFFTSTLAISPHKVQEKLKNFGALAAEKHSVSYLHRNFMEEEGFKNSVQFTKDHEIYRQDYCGCYFSLYEGGPSARKLAQELNLEKIEKGFQNPFLLKTGKETSHDSA